MAANTLTEDKVRDMARDILGFEDSDYAISGTGQLTTFNKLGFKGVADKPDGWYLPKETSFPAIILEVKASNVRLRQPQVEELQKNCLIANGKYKYVIGILWNGEDIVVLKDGVRLDGETRLKNKEYYLGLFAENRIDTQKIFTLTKRINDVLHFKLGINNLYHRMIFTACALVAKREGAPLMRGMTYNTCRTAIREKLLSSNAEAIKKNAKLNILLEVFSEITMNQTADQEAVDRFIESVAEISDNINSDFWNGEDVMAIFFHEFTRYKGKSEQGQVFTPDNITSLMYRLIDVGMDDVVFDGTCGSGAFLVKAMCNMVKEAGGNRTEKARHIKQRQLYGIELHREIFALACANMLIHKDGKTNIENMDCMSVEATRWIQEKGITRVLMNPPFENKYGCMKIVQNVLDSVDKDVPCAFIMPDNKLEKNIGMARRLLLRHRLEKIIKLPEDTFTGVTTSIFIFRAKVPQDNAHIFACDIHDDGLETIKNQGRQDVRGRWKQIEDYWVDVIHRQSGDTSIRWLDPKEALSYQIEPADITPLPSDFRRSVLNYILFENHIDESAFGEAVLSHVLYGTPLPGHYAPFVKQSEQDYAIDASSWQPFSYQQLFSIVKGKRLTKADMTDGDINYIGATAFNNGIREKIGNNEHLHKAGTITVCYNGSIGEAFYQTAPFWATDDVNVLYPRFPINKYIALFFTTLIRIEGKRFGYNDKWTKEKMEKTRVRLPVTADGKPDFAQMEAYMRKRFAQFVTE
ncbi:MAG: N-6 DNA methylase [Bacteroidaceae bacterium]|nr:N-6 DNA methylase [Bacteroidaceae bacterium]